MATYPLNFIGKAVSTEKLSLSRRQAAMQSPWTYAQQTVNTASQWQLEFGWPAMTTGDAEVVAAWLDSLRGQLGTFMYQPRQSVLSTLTGRLLQAAAYAYNNTVTVKGWGNSKPSELRLGQYMQIGEQLLRITSAPASSGSSGGTCVIEFEPALRRDFAPNTPVEFQAPRGKFRLSSSDGYGYQLDPDRRPTFGTIACQEAVE